MVKISYYRALVTADRPTPTATASTTVLGLYRSSVLAGVTAVLPAVGVAVGIAGTRCVLSWSARLTAPLVVRALAVTGEVLTGAVPG